jgi:hypothetical protein
MTADVDQQPKRGADRDYCPDGYGEGHHYASCNVPEERITHRTGVWYRRCMVCQYVDLSEIARYVAYQADQLARAVQDYTILLAERDAVARRLGLLEDDRNRVYLGIREAFRRIQPGLWDPEEYAATEIVSLRAHRDQLLAENLELRNRTTDGQAQP